MKNWMGKFCLFITLVLALIVLGACSSSDKKTPATGEEIDDEVNLKEDREKIAEMRKDIPEEVKKSNDRLGEVLARWKAQKTPPEELREKFSDEIRKNREKIDKKHRRQREEFTRQMTEKRKKFQAEQKEDREDFYSRKRKSEARQDFIEKQSEERENFTSDQRDMRTEFEETLKDERKAFEADVASRWTEFRTEFPEYQRLYREMKAEEVRKKLEEAENPKPYAGWPYKFPGEKDAPPGSAPVPPEARDVNKGGDGWPATRNDEFEVLDKMPGVPNGP